MTIVGRITKDAVVNRLKDERKVVNFSLAINETYKQKAGEYVKVTTYCNCSYWISERIAENLKKGTLIEVTGRIYVTAYAGGDGVAEASLNCHVNQIKIHAWPKDVELSGKAVEKTVSQQPGDDVYHFKK